MERRAIDFFSKFLFCIRVSRSFKTLIKLIVNSKKFSRFYKNQSHIAPERSELPKSYLLNLVGQRKNLFLRTFSGDISIFYEVFWRRVYSTPQLDWTTIKCIIGLGANVGMSSLFFRTLAPEAKIVAIEPDPDNFSILKMNTESERSSGHINIIHAAAAEFDGMLSFEKSWLSYNTKVIDHTEGPKVKSVSMNMLVREYCIDSIDLIKVDVEGFENRLFGRNTEWLDLVEHIIVEIHSKESFETFSNAVTKFGFSIRKLSDGIADEGIYLASKVLSFSNLKGQGK